MSSVKSACSSFDRQFNERGDLSYTVLTSSMIEYAAKAFNVKLTRKTSTKTAS
ncbi:MAG: hypothetical protein MJ233_05615 [Mycoplasmoidaceae bacterium]|nr:hypothetical protein [Mycoplasmoidaceae bacterium]